MEKRKVGERAEILIDTIDLEILEYLNGAESGILELANYLNINHKNLKPHIEKLIRANLLSVLDERDSEKSPRRITIISSEVFSEHKEGENCKVFRNILKKINERNRDTATLSEIWEDVKRIEEKPQA